MPRVILQYMSVDNIKEAQVMWNLGCEIFANMYNMCIMVLCTFTMMFILITKYSFSVVVIELFAKSDRIRQ